jgi:FkbM family methyltransferase
MLAAIGFCRFSGHLLWASGITGEWSLVDCGANRGVFLTRALAQLPAPRSVVCVEANSVLVDQFPVPAGTSVTVLHRAVVGIADGTEIEFSVSENCEASSIYTSVAGVFGVGQTVRVQKTTLHDLLDMLPIGTSIVVKLDIEGSELDVLEQISAECLLRIQQLSVEFHDTLDRSMLPRVRHLMRMMCRNGFVMVKGDAPGNEDVLFIRADRICGWVATAQVMAAKTLTASRGLLKTIVTVPAT